MTDIGSADLLALTADIAAAHVSYNDVGLDQLPALIVGIHKALGELGRPEPVGVAIQQPAVPVRSSVRRDHIVCLEDGKKLKLLKRHLRSVYGMTPDQYRAKWQLPADYPMVAPTYAETRKAFATKIGLGRKKPAEPAARAAFRAEDAPKQADMPVSAEAAASIAGPEVEHEAGVSSPVQKPVRSKLGLRLPETADAGRPRVAARSGQSAGDPASTRAGSATSADQMLYDAIREHTCLGATYNKDNILLAPHMLYTVHEEPFVRGVTLERNGKRPRELKIGTFKVAGLGNLRSTARRFVPQPGFDSEPPSGVILAMVQPR